MHYNLGTRAKGAVLKRAAILLVALNFYLFGAMILNLNVQELENKVELILNFDIPFEGKIVQKKEKEKIILYLPDVKILAPWQKKLNTTFVYQLEVLPDKGGCDVVIYTTQKVKIFAAKSKDGFSLKIEIKNLSTPPTTKESSSFSSFLRWIFLIITAILIFLIVRKNFFVPSTPTKTKTIYIQTPQTPEFEIKFEKPLDEQNKIALISFKGIDYLVLIGTTNVLLGKYKKGEIDSMEEFENAIQAQNISQAKEEKETKTPPKEEEIFTTIEEYKKKASGGEL